jgi:hypothetical protein
MEGPAHSTKYARILDMVSHGEGGTGLVPSSSPHVRHLPYLMGETPMKISRFSHVAVLPHRP